MSASTNWRNVSIGYFVELINGFAFPSEGFTNGEGMPLIRIRDLARQNTEVNFRGKYTDRYLVKKNDLLIGMDGDFLTVKWKGNDALLNQRVCKLLTKDSSKLEQDFLYYRIIDEILRINRITAATTVKHLSSNDILGIEITLPSAAEQTKIAEILSTVERAIEQTEALIAKQQRIKTGLMQDLLTRGIDEHGNLRSEQTHKFKDSPLGRIPVEWEVLPVEQLMTERIIADVQDGNHGELHPKSHDFVDDGIPFIMASDISGGFIDTEKAKKITEQQYHRLRIGFAKPGDVLLSHKASIGFVALVPNYLQEVMLTPQVTYYRISRRDLMSPVYLAQFFRSPWFQNALKNFAKQSTRDYIGILAQRKLNVAYPKQLAEQEQICFTLSSQDARMLDLQKLQGKLCSFKTALMQDLLTGKKRVTTLLNDTEVV